MSFFVLVRHGHVGRDERLSDLGRRQMLTVFELLTTRMGLHQKPVILSSPCGYVQESAQILAKSYGNDAGFMTVECLIRNAGAVTRSKLFRISKSQPMVALTHLEPMMEILEHFLRSAYSGARGCSTTAIQTGSVCVIDHRDKSVRIES